MPCATDDADDDEPVVLVPTPRAVFRSSSTAQQVRAKVCSAEVARHSRSGLRSVPQQ